MCCLAVAQWNQLDRRGLWTRSRRGRLPLVGNCESMRSIYGFLSTWQLSTRIGTVEVFIAFGVCAWLWSANVSVSKVLLKGGDMVVWRSSDQSRLDSCITL